MSQEQKSKSQERISALKARAELLKTIRTFFEVRGVLEVETPLMGKTNCPDVHIDPFYTQLESHNQTLVLQSSPEFCMKRLLCEGVGSIYQICKAFRNSEVGSQHNPEFTMLEWYRVDWTYLDLIQEVVELITLTLNPKQVQIIEYRHLFEEYVGLNPWQSQDFDKIAAAHHLQILDLDHDGWLDYLLTHIIFPKLDPTTVWVIKDFPASQAALAQLGQANGESFGKRFECYYQGLELANGYDELLDVEIHRKRFIKQNQQREARGKKSLPLDQSFLNALERGLPACAGVALGVDRLLMLKCGKNTIQEVLAYPYESL